MVKTKALISFAVTAKLICGFVFAYADCWFSSAAAQIYLYLIYTCNFNDVLAIALCNFALIALLVLFFIKLKTKIYNNFYPFTFPQTRI